MRMLADIKRSLGRRIDSFIAFLLKRNILPQKKGLRILLYHSVGEALPHDQYGICVSRDLFIAQMHFLRFLPGIRIGSLKQCLWWLETGLLEHEMAVAITFDDGYKDNLTTVAPLLEELGYPFSVFVIADFINAAVSSCYLSSDNLRELAKMSHVSIGSHGTSHRPLHLLESAQVSRELGESRKKIEDIIMVSVDTMSYPHGGVNHQVLCEVKKSGFRVALSSFAGINRHSFNPLLLKRTEVLGGDAVERFGMKIVGGADWRAIKQLGSIYWRRGL